MNRSKVLVCALAASLLLIGVVVGAAAWDADFTPSTYNPGVGGLVEFEICESCLGTTSGFIYRWDFNGDGETDLESTTGGLASAMYDEAGYYIVTLTMQENGGTRKTCQKGLWVGETPAYAVREVLEESSGTVFVLITIRFTSEIVAPAVEERILTGWQIEVIEAGEIVNLNAEKRREEVAWMQNYEAGDELTFSYRLHPGTATGSEFSGDVTGFHDGYFRISICGALTLP